MTMSTVKKPNIEEYCCKCIPTRSLKELCTKFRLNRIFLNLLWTAKLDQRQPHNCIAQNLGIRQNNRYAKILRAKFPNYFFQTKISTFPITFFGHYAFPKYWGDRYKIRYMGGSPTSNFRGPPSSPPKSPPVLKQPFNADSYCRVIFFSRQKRQTRRPKIQNNHHKPDRNTLNSSTI